MQEVQKLDTDLSLDRDLYEVFAAVDGSGLDATAKRLLDKTLLDFHRGGVDKDDATRARVKELSERAILVGQEFSKNIRDDVRSVKVTPDKLDGMPQDWIDAHVVDEDGLVTADHRLPRRRAVLDLRARPRHPAGAADGVPQPRVAGQRRPAQGALRDPSRARAPPRLPRLGGLRRRGQDDQGRAPRSRSSSTGSPSPRSSRGERDRQRGPRPDAAGLPRRRDDRRVRPGLLRRGRPARAARRRRPAGAHLLRLHRGAPRTPRGHRPAVRPDLPARRGRRALGRGGRRVRRVPHRHRPAPRPDLPRPAPARRQVQARGAVRPGPRASRTVSSPRACSSATSRVA